MAEGVINVTDATLDRDVLKSDMPVLLDVWASWCPPCRRLAPVVEELAADNAGRLKVAKMDADQNPATASDYNVLALPTLIIFRNGRETARLQGATSKPELQRWVNQYI